MLSILTVLLFFQGPPHLDYTPPPPQPVTATVYPGYWEEADGTRHDYDGNKLPIAAALIAADSGDVVKLVGVHQGVDIGHGNNGRRKVPSLDGVELRGGELAGAYLGPACGDITFRGVTFNQLADTSATLISDNVFSDAELNVIGCTFMRGVQHKKWDARIYGRKIVFWKCKGYGAKEWFLYAQNPVGGLVFAQCVGRDYGRGLVQLCTRFSSPWNSSGDWWLSKSRSYNSGWLDGAMAFTTAGLGGGGTVYMLDLKSFESRAGALICWGDKKQKELTGNPWDPIQSRQVVGSGWMNDIDGEKWGTAKCVIVNPYIDHPAATKAAQMLGHTKEVEVWGYGQKTAIMSPRPAIDISYQQGQPVEEVRFFGREDPDDWPWYGYNTFRRDGAVFDPELQ